MDLSGGYGDLEYVILCNAFVLWGSPQSEIGHSTSPQSEIGHLMSDLRSRTRPISKTVEKVPDDRIDREVQSQKNRGKIDVQSQKKLKTIHGRSKWKKTMFDLNKTWRN